MYLKDTLSSAKDTSTHHEFLFSKFHKYINSGRDGELWPKRTYLALRGGGGGGGGGGCSKTNKGKQRGDGGRGSKLGNLE